MAATRMIELAFLRPPVRTERAPDHQGLHLLLLPRIRSDRQRLRVALSIHGELHRKVSGRDRWQTAASAASATTTAAPAEAAAARRRRRPQIPHEAVHA